MLGGRAGPIDYLGGGGITDKKNFRKMSYSGCTVN